MPQRTLTLALLWLAMAVLLALLGLLWPLRAAGAGVAVALGLILLLLPLPPLGLLALRRSDAQARAHAAAGEARTRFLAQLSHEIRTPMNAFMGMTQLALQTQLTPEQRDLLTKADFASHLLLELVNDMLDVAKIESGRMRIEVLPLRLEDVVAQAVELVRPLHRDPGVALICDWADGSLLAARGQLRGDALRLQQVLAHLLTNAIRVTAAGQVLLRIAARPTDEHGRVPLSITVQDSGIGLSPEQIAGLFSPAASAASAASGEAAFVQRHAGAGLGLTITHRLVELMGGRLDARSQPGHGSRFEIQLALPLDPDAAPPAPLKARRLLVAKARADSRESTLALLRHLGLGAGLAASADGADTLAELDAARRDGRAFDWLLLDWHLPGPGPTGAELLARLRRDHPALRVAVLRQPGSDEDPAPARAFGARALCRKPLLPGELRHLLDNEHDDRPAVGVQSLAGLRVLLVEDHPVNQEIALRLLGSRGAQVDVAGDGQQGLDKLQAGGPGAYDLVLMDLQMPVLDGLTATRRLRELPGFETLPVLAMTAHAQADERAQCLAAGMQGHIAKPLDVARLVRELQRYRPAPAPQAEPVLDSRVGLHQFDGLADLYRRTLRAFAEQYAAGVAGWSDWLAGGDWGELRRAAHTLQGLAATLGARPLHRAALALEQAAAAADAAVAERHLGRVDAALSLLLGEVRRALAHGVESAAAAQGPADLGELRRLLSQSDSRALDWWQAHGQHSGLDAEARGHVEQALAALDFDAAALALKDGP